MTTLAVAYAARFAPVRWLVALHLLSVVAGSALGIAPALFAGFVVARLTDGGSAGSVAVLALAILGAGLVHAAVGFVSGYLGAAIGETVAMRFQVDLYRHLQRLGADFYHQTHIGEIATRLTGDVARGISPVYGHVVDLLSGAAFLGAAMVALALLDARLLAAFAILVAANLVIFTLLLPRIERTYRELQDANGKLTAHLTEAIAAHSLIRAFAREERAAGDVEGRARDLAARQFSADRFLWRFMIMMWAFYVVLGPFGLLLAGSVFVAHGAAIGVVIAAFFCWRRASDEMWNLCGGATGIASAIGSMRRAFAFFDETPLVADPPGAPALTVTRGAIRFEGARFRYPTRSHEFELGPLDLELEPGGRTALVGTSGSGKTTVAQLLTRVYDPRAGRITIDGVDIASVQQESLRSSIGVVMQETLLFTGTIRDNLAFVRRDADDARMMAALAAAGLAETIARWSDGLGTVIGEGGFRLSGGQRQRLSLARVFLLDPPVVILDEATSALDAATEAALWRSFDALLVGRTALIITHRMPTALRADRVAVLERGRLVAAGKPRAVHAVSAEFRLLCAAQRVSPGEPS
jgi:ABC-type multidrug transport system fused ATPase/permease subunit